MFLCRGGYRSIRKSLRQRGWVEQEYTSTHPNSQPNESPTKVHSPRTVGAQRLHRRSSHDKYADSSSDDDSDAADLGDEGSEEEYSDEEEYRMLVRGGEGRREMWREGILDVRNTREALQSRHTL